MAASNVARQLKPTSPDKALVRRPLFIADSPAARARQLRARVITRLNREYLQGAISLDELEHEMDAVKEYIPAPHEDEEVTASYGDD